MNIFDSYIDAGQALQKKDRQEFYTAVIEYLAYDVEPQLKGAAHAVFIAIKPSLELSKQRAKAGSNGGKAKQANQDFASVLLASKSEANAKANSEAKNNSKSIYKEDVSKDTSKKARFEKPNAKQISEYARERGFPNFNAQGFFDYYESNGWKVGRNPMKDWKAAVRTWLSKEKGGKSEFSKYDR